MEKQNKKYNLILIFCLILFLIIYSFLVWSVWWPGYGQFSQMIFNWPDENANYFFAQVLAQSGSWLVPENLNILSQNLLHTRSINVLPTGDLVPMTFLPNIVIFGLFFKILGPHLILLLTPALAIATVYIIYSLTGYIFKDNRLALVTALLFLGLAPWVYFANFSLLPTILFIFLASAGYLAWAKSFSSARSPSFYWFLGALLLSLALVCRPTELVWLALTTLFVLYLQRAKLNKIKIVGGSLICLAVVVGFLGLNKITYGNYFTFGYLDFETGRLSRELVVSSDLGFLSALKLLLMPFGFDPLLIGSNVYKYFFRLAWPPVIFALLGLYFVLRKICIKKADDRAWHKYLLLVPWIFIIILLYYGSWDLADPLVKNLNGLSISYVRYFMPLYILILPLAAYGLIKIFWSAHRAGQWSFYMLVAIIMTAGVYQAFYAKNDGLLATQSTLVAYYQQFVRVKNIAPADAIIINSREDKIFFPYYKVVVPQGDLPLWPRLLPLLDQQPVYYYTDKNDADLEIDRSQANVIKLELAEPVNIYHNFRLFKVIKK